DRERIERIQDRARAGHRHRRGTGNIADDRGPGGVDHAAVGNDERARPHRDVANEETEGAADVPGRAGPGHRHGRRGESGREGGPRKGRKGGMSGLAWLLSTPPLLMVTDAGAKLPMIVSPVTATLEPAPVITALPATPKLVVVSEPPLVTVSVPPSTMVEPPTGRGPPLLVSAGLAQVPQ